ncbi:class I SAM-dependent methyltransferase [Sagittula sp. MA-2]|jgi:hypothetical protein|uniref:class I SAM-dependent methyltransferase n=1 Tax=Sagittula sp. MA-2 TaxID=3048007 RepID=UPI0024C3CBED|nr:class I SAM-dependent methyltransferase [Sagittula sp. MA-2]WHZ37733.1 class I SAM-dependent methyltransferase [Sagittula sp. MA-2]
MPAPGHAQHEALFHYQSEFDAIAVLRRHAPAERPSPAPGTVTNFLGLKVPVAVCPAVLEPLAGTVEGLPDPGNWHADIAEWAAALRAVEAAEGRFTVVELGCGWGCWLMNTGLAARRRGLELTLVGVEGDAGHLVQAEAALALNGFRPEDWRLVHGIAAARPGKAIFPGAGAAGWGGAAVFDPDAATLARAEADPKVQVLDCYPLEELAGGRRIDLLHIDIQGAETAFVAGNADALDRQVRRVLIGTHSRTIEGALEAHFLGRGWRMEIDRPAIAPLRGGRPVVAIDGVQMWSNPALCTAAAQDAA